MTRDGERIIELILFLSITAAMLFGAHPDKPPDQRWGVLTQFSSIQIEQTPATTAKLQTVVNSKHKQPINLMIDTQEPKIEKISGLRELDRLFFAKPLNTTQSKMARQSC